MKGISLLVQIALIVEFLIIALAFANLNVGLLTQIDAENVLAGTFNGGNYVFPNDLNVSGNLTGNFIYGSMWLQNDSGTPVDLTAITVWENLTQLNSTYNNGFIFARENNSLTPLISGIYKVDYSISFSNGANSIFGFAVAINSTPQNDTMAHRKTNAAGDIGNLGATGLIRLGSNDVITLMVRDEEMPIQDPEMHVVNFNIMRVGD